MALKNERIIYVSRNNQAGLADVVADIRRNGVAVGSAVGLSDIGNGRYELLLTPAALSGYGGAGYYDFYINSASKDAPAVTARYILENNEDDLEFHLGTIESKIDVVDGVVDGIAVDTTSIKGTVEDTNTVVKDASYGLANLKTLIDNVQGVVTNISNVTRFSAPIPKDLVRLEVGTNSYKIPLYLYDTNGSMEDPDLDQIQVQLANENGAVKDSLLSGFTVQPFYATKNALGQYEFDLDIPDTALEEQINFKFTYVENGITLVQGNSSQVREEANTTGLSLEATSQEILADTAAMQPQVADIQSKVNSATFGLQAIKNLLNLVDTNTDGIEGEINNATYGLSALKTSLDTKASQSSVNIANAGITAMQGAGYVEGNDSMEAISLRVYTGGNAV